MQRQPTVRIPQNGVSWVLWVCVCAEWLAPTPFVKQNKLVALGLLEGTLVLGAAASYSEFFWVNSHWRWSEGIPRAAMQYNSDKGPVELGTQEKDRRPTSSGPQSLQLEMAV